MGEMNQLDLPDTSDSGLTATASGGKTGIELSLEGSADLRAQGRLGELLERVHARAEEAGASEVIVDLRRLEFMNSSCFKCFISWIEWIRELEESNRYGIRFLTDSAMLWQRRSLHALSRFATDLIRIQPVS
jgi:hypothetical protein